MNTKLPDKVTNQSTNHSTRAPCTVNSHTDSTVIRLNKRSIALSVNQTCNGYIFEARFCGGEIIEAR